MLNRCDACREIAELVSNGLCAECAGERGTLTEEILKRQPKPWTQNVPQSLRIAREDLVAVMAAILTGCPQYQTWGDAVDDATLIYDATHKTSAATPTPGV